MDERKKAIESEIAGLKQLLTGTDYKALKFAEGQISEKTMLRLSSRDSRSGIRSMS